MEDNENAVLPAGPALPPGKTMKCETKLFGKTKLKIINEKSTPASVAIDGKGLYIPGSTDTSSGTVSLSNFYFGRTLIITNQSAWVLKLEQ